MNRSVKINGECEIKKAIDLCSQIILKFLPVDNFLSKRFNVINLDSYVPLQEEALKSTDQGPI